MDKCETNGLLPELEFFARVKATNVPGKGDIYIRKYENIGKSTEEGKFYIGIAFFNGVDKIITTTGYVEFAVLRNRLFFRETDVKNGLKITKVPKSKSSTRTTVCSDEFVKKLAPFEGCFELKHDKFYDLYYIEQEV